MKKITLLSTLLCGFIGLSQSPISSVSDIVGDNPTTEIFIEQNFNNRDACSQATPSNEFENGHGNLHLLIVANDFSVNAGEEFSINQLKFNVIYDGADIGTADMYIYEDTDGFGPGAEINSVLGVETTTENIGALGTFSVDEVTADLDEPIVLPGGESGTIYWIGVQIAYTGASSYWEGTTIIDTDYEGYLFSEDEDTWNPFSVAFESDPYDSVFEISGDCAPLSINDELLDQVSIYPNPTTDIINVNVPSSVEVSGITIYDILGKNTGASINNGAIDISNLTKGIYILSVETTAGTLTQKVVKK